MRTRTRTRHERTLDARYAALDPAAVPAPTRTSTARNAASHCVDHIVSACACGASYDAAAWAALVYVGVQDFDGVEPSIELRNCTCGSTLAIERLGSAS